MRIPVYKPNLGREESDNVADCMNSTWISSKGKYINQFESDFAAYVGAAHAATVSNGTVAIHLALIALGVGPGDEVIVPSLTYVASVNAVVHCGATPVFVDSSRDTWQIDLSDVERKITPRTKAVMAVHLYGYAANVEELRRLVDRKGVFLVEDCAEAIGTRISGQHVGTFGHISTFSFFGNKTITTGEGGMVVTNDEMLNERAVHFKGQGLAKYREYWHDVVGYNYRMTNIQAAIGVAQLKKVDYHLSEKREIFARYYSGLSSSGVLFPELEPGISSEPSYWMVSILVESEAERDRLRKVLMDDGVETRPVFFPVHTMPMYSSQYVRLPNAEYLGRRGINLPSWPGLSSSEQEGIIKTLVAAR